MNPWRRLFGYLLVGFLTAWAFVVVLGWLGATRDMQRVAAFVCITGALWALLRHEQLDAHDALRMAATVLVLAVSTVTLLGIIGSIDEAPPIGCISSDGDIQATISHPQGAIVWTKATPGSDETGLLLVRGCRLRFTGWCLGAIHRNAMETALTDSRWLILSDGRGLVPAGYTTGTIARDIAPQTCPGHADPPGAVEFREARVDVTTERLQLLAWSPHAASIGFAIRDGDRWRRLGWDTDAVDKRPVKLQFPVGKPVKAGAVIAATPCIAFERPTNRDVAGAGNAEAKTLILKSGPVEPGDEKIAYQPVGTDVAEVACKRLPRVPWP
jgi:hypothetical protein